MYGGKIERYSSACRSRHADVQKGRSSKYDRKRKTAVQNWKRKTSVQNWQENRELFENDRKRKI